MTNEGALRREVGTIALMFTGLGSIIGSGWLFGAWRAAPAPVTLAPAPSPELAPAPRDNAPAQVAQGELAPAQPGAIEPGARPVEPPLGPPADARPPQAYPPSVQAAPARDMPADRAAGGRVATPESSGGARPATTQAPPVVEHYGAPIEPAAPAARGNAVASINDLPPSVRAQLPRLTVGGAIYSETPSARMVILNGQVFHEGDKPAADTVLEQIRLKSAVLNFRGQRYEIAF